MTSKLPNGGPMHVFHDTGPPKNSNDYTTLVIIHGYVWHSGTFSRLIPLAHNYNARLILLNRRDYPGSAPYTQEERALIPTHPQDATGDHLSTARAQLSTFLNERARELYDFLEDLVKRDGIPRASPEKNAGGIVVVGWSFGVLWMLALLSYISSFPIHAHRLQEYVRRVVIHDTGHGLMGYPDPDDIPSVFDPSFSTEEREAAFDAWIGGYYSHGRTTDALGLEPDRHPLPTLSTLTVEERAAMTQPPIHYGRDSDVDILHAGEQSCFFTTLKEKALYLGRAPGSDGNAVERDEWRDVEMRFIWCERSVPQVAYAMMLLERELEDAAKRGKVSRKVKLVRVKEGNHFIHWDYPNVSMRAFLGEEDNV